MRDFVIPTKTVEWGTSGQVVEVRGLSFNDFTLLFTQFGPTVDRVFEFFGQLQSENPEVDIKAFGVELLHSAPNVVASLIALAADMSDRVTQVARMPLPVQVRVLEAIYELTVTEAGGLQDFLQTVLRLAQSVRGTVTKMAPNLNTGTSR